MDQAVAVGAFVLAAAGLLGCVLLAMQIIDMYRKWTAPPPAPAAIAPPLQYVTRGELDVAVASLKGDIQKSDTDTKAEMKRVESSLAIKVDAVSEYAHKSFHEMANNVNTLGLNLERSKIENIQNMRAQLDAAVKPLNDKLDRLIVTVAKIHPRLGENLEDQ